MKKAIVLLTACMLSGLLFANHYEPTGTSTNNDRCGIISSILIDGQYPNFEDNELELGVFCGNECRASALAYNFTKVVGPYTFHFFRADANVICTVGDELSFKLWNDRDGYELETSITVTATQDGYGDIRDPFVLDFTPSGPQPTTYTLDIPGYGAGNAGGYHLIASPVTEPITPSTENGFISGNFDLYYFDQNGDGGTPNNNEWINYELQGGGYATWKITSGKGYLYASESGTTLQFTGTACTDGLVNLVYSEDNPDANMHGWNLIGNPLAEETTLMGADRETGDFTEPREFYVMNDDGNELTPGDGNIAAMQGVFVKATSNEEPVQFVPAETDDNGKLFINVLKDRANTLDRAIVRLNGHSTLPKFMLNPENTKIYIAQDDEDFAVVSSGNVNSLPVNFKAKEDGTYRISVDITEVRMEYLHLIDNMTGADIDLLVQPDYQFNATTHDYEARFTLVFRAMTGVQEQGQESFCFVNGRSLYFCEDVEGATLSLVDMTGRMVRNETLKGNGVSLDNLSEGVYVVRLAKGNDVKTQKVVVR